MAQRDTFTVVVEEIALALAPLRNAISSSEQFVSFMAQLGWRVESVPEPIQELAGGLAKLITELQRMLAREETGAGIGLMELTALRQAVQDAFGIIKAISSVPDGMFPPSLIADNFKSEFPAQLVQFLVIRHLTRHHPQVAFILRALGVVRINYLPATGNRRPYMRYRFDFSDLPKVLDDPSQIFMNAYGWGTDNVDYGSLFQHLENFLLSLQVDVTRPVLGQETANLLAGGIELSGQPERRPVAAVFFERMRNTGRLAAELLFIDLPGDGTVKPGLAILPRFNGPLDFRLQLGPNIAVTINSSLDMQGGIGLIMRPGRGIDILVGFENGRAPTSAQGSISVRAEYSDESQEPITLLGSPEASRLEFKNVSGIGGLFLDFKNNSQDLFVELELQGGKLVIAPSQGDGFLQTILPRDGIGAAFDIVAGISLAQGFYFRGSGGLEISVPAHVSLGPVELQSVTIGAQPKEGLIPVNLGATLSAVLGPLTAVVENMGLRANLSFPDGGGNIGPVDLAIGFKPPNGVGLSLDTGVVKGGGYLYFDFDREDYAGVLELSIAQIVTVKAIGLITTKMPDGSKGFSLLIIITAEFGTGMQLGFGFTLLGLGGLLGLNRTMNLQPLIEGVRSGAINSIMFPQNPIENAPRIISDLRVIFPPYEGKFLIGPMAKLGWGTPALITVSLGIIIEIPGNIAILGMLKIALPADDAALIIIQVNFSGAIEFDKKRLYFFAATFDSRVLFLTIEGEMGLLAAWGENANFVVSVGGFHPRFNPPPLPIPSARRIAIFILNTDIGRIRSESYFAVTSNTAQFGAKIEVMFDVGAGRVDGHLVFDALFQFSPFFFITEISASISFKVFGIGLFSIRLQFSLEGPAPWRAHGTGTLSFFFFDVSADFDITWGESKDTTLPPIAVMPLLNGELEKLDNWRAELPAGNNLLVSLRKLSDIETAQVLHPLGTLRVSQRAVPLDIRIDKVGSQKPSDANEYKLTPTVGLVKAKDTEEQFAKAQFINMSDAEKLSQRAFDPLHGGVLLSSGAQQLASAKMAKRRVRYEQIIIDNNFKRFRRRFKLFSSEFFGHFLKGAAVTKSELSKHYKTQLDPFEDKVRVKDSGFTVAYTENNKAYSVNAMHFASESMANQFIRDQVAGHPELHETLHVIPQFEASI